MKGMIVPSLTAIAMIATTGAYAAEANGSIKTMDMKAHTVTLDNGRKYELPASYDMSKLQANEKVKVTYTNKRGRHMASGIVAQ